MPVTAEQLQTGQEWMRFNWLSRKAGEPWDYEDWLTIRALGMDDSVKEYLNEKLKNSKQAPLDTQHVAPDCLEKGAVGMPDPAADNPCDDFNNRGARTDNASRDSEQTLQSENPRESTSHSPETKPLEVHVAPTCRHRLHPSLPLTTENCPSCIISTLLLDLHRSSSSWAAVKGPYRGDTMLPPGRKKKKAWKTARNHWYAKKLDLVKFMYMLEEQALVEREWDVEHPEELDGCGDDVVRASEVLSHARRTMPWRNWSQSFCESGVERRKGAGKNKTVCWATELVDMERSGVN